MTYTAKVVCVYCGKQFDTKDGFAEPGMTTHGCCPECGEREKEKILCLKEAPWINYTRS